MRLKIVNYLGSNFATDILFYLHCIKYLHYSELSNNSGKNNKNHTNRGHEFNVLIADKYFDTTSIMIIFIKTDTRKNIAVIILFEITIPHINWD